MDGSFYKSQSYSGIPVQIMEGDSVSAAHLLMNNGINPLDLSDSQLLRFLQQNPAVQQQSINNTLRLRAVDSIFSHFLGWE